MKIVHITDFHFNQKHQTQQKDLVNKLVDTLKEEGDIDIVLFTGDLVDKGGNNGKYIKEAADVLFSNLVIKNVIERRNIFICCGNHDISRDKEWNSIKTYIENLKTGEQIDNFVTQNTDEFTGSLKNLKKYIDFQDKFYLDPEDETADLYTIHHREINGTSIGIATINTAWRAYESGKEKGNLIYPPVFIENIISKLKDYEVKIILTHYPLNYLKDFIYYDVETLIYNKFNFLFSGHTHLDKIETNITGDEGIFCCVSPCTLTYGYTDNKIGFSLVNIDDDNIYEVLVTRYLYDKRNNSFYKSNPISVVVPLENKKQEIIKLKKNVRQQYLRILDEANESLILSYDTNGNSNTKGFLGIFTQPVLRTISKTEFISGEKNYTTLNFEDFFKEESFIIYGKSKSGKTSILYKILLDMLKRFPNSKSLPLYINYKEYNHLNKEWDWKKLFSRTYGITYNKLATLNQDYHFKILIDNYSPDNDNFIKTIENVVENNNVSVIITSDDYAVRSYNNSKLFSFQYESSYIHDINRVSIRSLVKKWPNLTNQPHEVIIEKLTKLFNQLSISCNYWTVSLFLWLFEKTNNVTLNNNVELIQLYIDELLDRTSLTTNKNSKIKFEELKQYLGNLAYYLLNKHASKGYTATFTEVNNFTENYRKQNIRFVIGVKDLFDLLINKGILKKVSDDNYTFRLNGVFEYFLAIYIRNNPDYRNSVINDPSYISFSNELQLYAGFEVKDKDFVEKLFQRTSLIYASIDKKYGDSSQIDLTLIHKIESLLGITINLKTLNQQLEKDIKALTPEEQDEVMDELQPVNINNEEVKLKIHYATSEASVEHLEKSLHLLARVFRNSSVDDIELNYKLLDFILQASCHLGFAILDNVKQIGENLNNNFDSNKEKAKMILESTTKFIPLIINGFLTDALAQENLERLIVDKINYYNTSKNNQFQLLLLYFLLIDLNPVKSINLMKDLAENVTIGIFRHAILLKFYNYFVFYSHNNKQFESDMKNLIRDLHLMIEPKSKKLIDKKLENLSRRSLIINQKSFN